MKKPISFFIITGLISLLTFATACSHETIPTQPKQTNQSATERTYEVLSLHDTNTVFVGTRKHTCRGRTSLCPDKCGHSGTLAVFDIEKYNVYEKTGEYGDPQTKQFVFMLTSTTGTSEVSKEIAERVNTLKPGEKVHLVWEHIYVTDKTGSKYPERPIRTLNSL